MAIKSCAICGKEFNAIANGKACSTDCSRVLTLASKRRANIKYRDKRIAYNRKYYALNRDRISEYCRAARAANPEKFREHASHSRLKNRTQRLVQMRRWREVEKQQGLELQFFNLQLQLQQLQQRGQQ